MPVDSVVLVMCLKIFLKIFFQAVAPVVDDNNLALNAALIFR